MMKLTDIISQRPDLTSTEMDGETVMMDITSGKYFKLSGVGGAIWNTIEFPISVDEVIENLLSEYDISREICEKETLKFLTQLEKKGLIVIEK